MEDVIEILKEFREDLERHNRSSSKLPSVISKAALYVTKFSPNSQQYKSRLEDAKPKSEIPLEIDKSYDNIIAVVDTLIEDVKISKTYTVVKTADYESIINEIKKNDEKISQFGKIEMSLETLKETNLKLRNEAIINKSEIVSNKTDLDKINTLYASEKAQHELLKAQFEKERNEFQVGSTFIKNDLTSAKAEISQLKEEKQKREIAKNSITFQKQADANKKNARLWIVAVIASIAAFVAVLFYGFSSNEELFNIAANILGKSKGLNAEFINKLILIEVAKKLGSKALIYSMLIYLISFLVKNYNAQMHNYVVNSHKSNALSSTVDLIGTAKQDDGNDKIILQATQAIFTTQKSGYQGTENEPSSPNLITNVIDSVMPKKG